MGAARRETVASALVNWHRQHGRTDLPWQQQRTPYRVWVSEIMLQQTQVATVIPYYNRFMHSFPDVKQLAAADIDRVLQHWTGLGYYARARNLHKTAAIIANDYAGQFPESLDELVALPGIGRSTAGAILSLACGQRQPILDGNVKRVLTRYHAIEGWPGKKQIENRLWELADEHTPDDDVATYTQAIMDLGATLCRRSKPLCESCPLQSECIAYARNEQALFPTSKKRKPLPVKETVFVIVENDAGEILLQRRPPAGIWGGLWCFPELINDISIEQSVSEELGVTVKTISQRDTVRHTFSHFQLLITPMHIKAVTDGGSIRDQHNMTWFRPDDAPDKGFPAPVVSILNEITSAGGKTS